MTDTTMTSTPTRDKEVILGGGIGEGSTLPQPLDFDCLGHIMTFCDPFTVLAFGKTCRKWRRLLPQIQKRWNRARGFQVTYRLKALPDDDTFKCERCAAINPDILHGTSCIWEVTRKSLTKMNEWCLSQGLEPASDDRIVDSVEAYHKAEPSVEWPLLNSARWLRGIADGPAVITNRSSRKVYTMRRGLREGLYERFDNGLLVKCKTYLHGLLEGPVLTWYPKAKQLKSSMSYSRDQLHGEVQTWRRKTGTWHISARFTRGCLTSLQTWWNHQPGELLPRLPVRRPAWNAKVPGAQRALLEAPSSHCMVVFDAYGYREWHRNRQLACDFPYQDGLCEGVHYTWYENGQLGTEITYKDGLANGPFKKYDYMGRMSTCGHHAQGHLFGEISTWEKGTLSTVETYRLIKGTPSLSYAYPYDGQVAFAKTLYELDPERLDLEALTNTIMGRPVVEEVTSERHGPYLNYDRDGVLRAQGLYVDGKLSNWQYKMDKNGRIFLKELYLNGELLRTKTYTEAYYTLGEGRALPQTTSVGAAIPSTDATPDDEAPDHL